MDLAIYINELLGLQGEVNVPGIGFFTQKRINGYYNEREGKFYPPHHEIVFDPQPKDDETLGEYISRKKNISPASAKYFIDKYTMGLKQEASSQGVNIPGLGHLYYEYATLAFKAAEGTGQNDPSFYGMAPVKPYKATEKPVVVEPVPEVPAVKEPEPEEEVIVPAEAAEKEEEPRRQIGLLGQVIEAPDEEYAEERSGGSKWIILLLLIIVLLLGFGGAYQYRPEWFGKPRPVDTTIIVNGPAPVENKKDTVVKQAIKKDSVSKSPVAPKAINSPVDTFAIKHYVVSGGSFGSLTNFNKNIQNYTSLGLHPRIAKQAGSQHQINFATFFNYADAKKLRDSIWNIPGVKKSNIFIQTYIPKK